MKGLEEEVQKLKAERERQLEVSKEETLY